MIWLAIYLYAAGMPVLVHLVDELHPGKAKWHHRVGFAVFWPLMLPVYAYAFVAGIIAWWRT